MPPPAGMAIFSNGMGIRAYYCLSSFWRLTGENSNATYAYLNLGEAAAPAQIHSRSICLNADIGQALGELAVALRK